MLNFKVAILVGQCLFKPFSGLEGCQSKMDLKRGGLESMYSRMLFGMWWQFFLFMKETVAQTLNCRIFLDNRLHIASLMTNMLGTSSGGNKIRN